MKANLIIFVKIGLMNGLMKGLKNRSKYIVVTGMLSFTSKLHCNLLLLLFVFKGVLKIFMHRAHTHTNTYMHIENLWQELNVRIHRRHQKSSGFRSYATDY